MTTAPQESLQANEVGEKRTARVIALALGNDILGDDAVGFLAARALKNEFPSGVDFVETGEAGLALVELLEGYERALLLDACVTGLHDVGTVLEFFPEHLGRVVAPSPHYAGLPEVLYLAERLGLEFPKEIRILAMEVEDPFTVREGLTPRVLEALPHYIARTRDVLRWLVASVGGN
ncbi:MAG: hydrogenase maturation protease [Candidatus Sumerlaeaceae bacterium]|nr:hydrogenase maturation protease [Candidatus Sumerlaeaceae bacterium]